MNLVFCFSWAKKKLYLGKSLKNPCRSPGGNLGASGEVQRLLWQEECVAFLFNMLPYFFRAIQGFSPGPRLFTKKKENILFTGCLSLHSHQLFILSNFFLGQLSQLFSRFVRSELCFHDAPLYEIRLNWDPPGSADNHRREWLKSQKKGKLFYL